MMLCGGKAFWSERNGSKAEQLWCIQIYNTWMSLVCSVKTKGARYLRNHAEEGNRSTFFMFFMFSVASRSFDPLTQIQCRNVFLYWLNETHLFILDLCWTFVLNEYFKAKICSLYKNICIFFNNFQIIWLIDSKSIPKYFPKLVEWHTPVFNGFKWISFFPGIFQFLLHNAISRLDHWSMTPPAGSFRIKLKFDLKEICVSLRHTGLSLNNIVVRVSSWEFFSLKMTWYHCVIIWRIKPIKNWQSFFCILFFYSSKWLQLRKMDI